MALRKEGSPGKGPNQPAASDFRLVKSLGQSGYHEIRRSLSPWRGRANCKCKVRFPIAVHWGEFNSCNCPEASSSSCCSADRECGEPIFCHAANASLWAESTANCSSNP